ncbi:MAG: chalcone isomerase family protein, partial [Vibrionaceae bacterium]
AATFKTILLRKDRMKKANLTWRWRHFVPALLLAAAFSAQAKSPQELMPQTKLVGQARMTYLLLDIYDAKLYAAEGKWRSDAPFVLELSYLRDLDGEAIAKRSIEEIRKQGFSDESLLSRWYLLLTSILPDVKKGTRLTGVVDQNRHTHFYLNGEPLAQVEDPLFTTWFFNIWLSEATSEPKLRALLLGEQS